MRDPVSARAWKCNFTPDGWEVVLTDDQARKLSERLLACVAKQGNDVVIVFEVEGGEGMVEAEELFPTEPPDQQ